MSKMTFLMPRSFRFVGIFLFASGLILAIARFHYGFKPGFLDLKSFAFYSEYLDSKYMDIISNNMSEELTGFCLITGLFLFAFSREKNENESMNKLRLRAFFITAYLNFLFLLLSIFFTFGFAFVYMLIVNMGISLFIYSFVFRILLRGKRSDSTNY